MNFLYTCTLHNSSLLLTAPDGRARNLVGLRNGVPDVDENTGVVGAVGTRKRHTGGVGGTTASNVDGIAGHVELSTTSGTCVFSISPSLSASHIGEVDLPAECSAIVSARSRY